MTDALLAEKGSRHSTVESIFTRDESMGINSEW
jgi:hypothetical protein